MSPFKHLFLFIVIISCSAINAQDQTVTITLTVDTELLGNDRNAPGGCTFSVAPADKVLVNDPNDPKTFTIEVDSTDIILWQGETTNGEEVKIKKIKYLGGTNIFNSESLKGKVRDGREKVKAKPIKNTPRDKDYEYGIRFKIKGEIFSAYEIDPKIKVGNS